jgi:HEPN domain-containing protein/predicted nucleotidyltransferase
VRGSTYTEYMVTVPADISEAVGRLVRAFDPTRVILFGSRARGDAHPDSDVDLLVVMPTVADPHATAIAMLTLLADLPMAKDVVVASEATIAQEGNAVGTIYRPALRDGLTLYQHARAEGEVAMDPRDAPSHEGAERWLRHAHEDLETAEPCLGNAAIPPRQACFFAQQAVEKALKAVLVARNLDVPRTHHLGLIVDLVDEPMPSLYAEAVKALTRWGMVGRYPGTDPQPDMGDARDGVETARRVFEAVNGWFATGR